VFENEEFVHKKIIQELTNKGWEFLKEYEFKETPIIFEEILRKKIIEFNKEIFDLLAWDEREKVINEVVSELKNKSWYNIHRFLKKGVPIEIKRIKEIINFKIIDIENIENNEFFFIHEGIFGKERKRPDFVLFINGLPFVVIEAKKENLNKEDEIIDEALGNILFYEKNKGTKELFNYAFISSLIIGCEGTGFYKASWPESNNKYLLKWKNKENKDYIFGIFERKILLDLFNNFSFLIKKNENEYKRLVANYIQYEATKKVLEDISNFNKALVWHWQGSGKTWTLFFTAYNYYKKRKKENKKSFVFILLDRVELKKQSFEKYNTILDLDWEFLRIQTIERGEELTKKLKFISEDKENSSFFITLIQKFKDNLTNKLKKENIKLKEEILILVDEAHRSVNGNLLLNVFEVFDRKNLKIVGFTGTPVIAKIKFKDGKYEIKSSKRNTFRIFSPNTEKGKFYSHLYFIKDSINDKVTVPLFFDNIVNENFQIPEKEEIKKKAEEIIRKYHEESLMDEIGDLEEELELNKKEERKLEKIFEFNNFYLNDNKLIEKKVEYVLKRIKEDTKNFSFKAFIVASNRYACIKYKEAIDKIAKKRGINLNAEVVITWESEKEEISRIEKGTSLKEDVELLINYGKKLLNRTLNINYYNPNKLNYLNEKIVEAFVNDKEFYGKKINVLIVTSKLLTGFDYPKLKVMYIDKAIGGVNLLQTVARVNRTYKEIVEKDNTKYKIEKRYGLIADLTGLSLIKRFNEVIDNYQQIIEITTNYKNIKIFDDIREKAKEFLEELKIFENYLKNNFRKIIEVVEEINKGNYKKEKIKEKINKVINNLFSLNKNELEGFIRKGELMIKEFEAYKFTISELVESENLRRIRIFIFILTITINKLKAAQNDDYLVRIDFEELKKAIREITDFGELIEGVKIKLEDLLKESEKKYVDKVEITIAINNKIRLLLNKKDKLSEKIRKKLENIKEKLKNAKEGVEYLKLKKELKEVLNYEEKIKNLEEKERFFELIKEYLKEKFQVRENLINKYKETIINIYQDYGRKEAFDLNKLINFLKIRVIKKILKEENKEKLYEEFSREELIEALGL